MLIFVHKYSSTFCHILWLYVQVSCTASISFVCVHMTQALFVIAEEAAEVHVRQLQQVICMRAVLSSWGNNSEK